jgi:hypothetical protein
MAIASTLPAWTRSQFGSGITISSVFDIPTFVSLAISRGAI